MRSVMPRHGRLLAAGPITTLILAACSASSTGGSALSISPSPSVAPSIEPSSQPSLAPPLEAVIKTGSGPITLAATSNSVWVELHRNDLVARIDPATNQQMEITDVPVHCVLAASGETVWATIAKLNKVTRFDASTGKALESWDLAAACGVTAVGDTAWVTSPADAAVYVLQEGVAEPIQRIDVAPDSFDVALDETSAWVSSESDGGTLWRIDRATYAATLVGKFPGVDAVEVAFGSVWLTSRPQRHLWKLNPADGTVVGQLDLREPSGVVAVGDSLWITLYQTGLLQLDPATLETRSEQALPYGYLSPPIYAFGSLWASALEADKVLRMQVNE
jgi:streptogramin lyase